MAAEAHDVLNWDSDDVRKWLVKEGHSAYAKLFADQHKIDGKGLLMLIEDDLRNPPMEIKVLGDIKRIMISVNGLKRFNHDHLKELLGVDLSHDSGCIHNSSASDVSHAYANNSTPKYTRLDSDAMDDDLSFHSRKARDLRPEYLKLLLSYIYMFIVFLLTAMVMVIVHDRVPDMEKYPPLPDLVLDNMPVIPWAFDLCELTATVLFVLFAITMFFHKHRFIILRRLFALTGTVFLLRCITMLITSLSVPGTHLKCEPRAYQDVWTRLERTLTISKGFGMSLQGVRTCGDYMFSGHTAVVTMLNFFITEYTPRKMYMIHTATWVMNIFGIFFILAAHEHYSIDVFVSFYITSRLFLYYHSLANNRALHLPDKMRMRIWFPMFSYFESKIYGILPNEYEWPLPYPKSFVELFEYDKKKLA